jgi:hypothetical protein
VRLDPIYNDERDRGPPDMGAGGGVGRHYLDKVADNCDRDRDNGRNGAGNLSGVPGGCRQCRLSGTSRAYDEWYTNIFRHSNISANLRIIREA